MAGADEEGQVQRPHGPQSDLNNLNMLSWEIHGNTRISHDFDRSGMGPSPFLLLFSSFFVVRIQKIIEPGVPDPSASGFCQLQLLLTAMALWRAAK